MTLTAFMLVTSCVFMLFAAVAIDLSLISTRQQELQRGCDAAALAACAELHDPAPLFTMLNANSPPQLHDYEPEADAPKRRLAQSAHTAAITFASKNPIGATPLKLQPNPTNDPEGQIVLGWIEQSDDPTRELIAWHGGGLLNSAQVQLRRQDRHGIALYVAQLLGMSEVNLTATSRATLDRRVYGFEPSGGVPVPAVPIVISRDSWHEQLYGDSMRDQWAKVKESDTFRPGSDRIPEVTIYLGKSDDQKNAPFNARIMLLGEHESETAMKQQLQFGLTSRDLAYSKGSLELLQQHTLCSSWPGIEAQLHEIRGQQRIWALGSFGSESNERLSLGNITNFVAGEVVSSSVDLEGRTCVVLQPCLMTTSTALLGESTAQNEFIGKVMLTR